jgi:uncharacterized membrane protein
MVLPELVSGLGLIIISASFVRLAVSDETEEMYLLALEYAFALALLLAGVGLIGLSILGLAL